MAVAARVLVLAAALLAAVPARADRDEIYAVFGYEAGATRYDLPANGSGSATGYAGALDLAVYYGLTNAVHLGGWVRASSSSDVHFSGVRVTLPDGSKSPGDLYEDHRSFGLGTLGLYRIDTGYKLAPLLELEAGFTTHQYRRIAHVPAGVAFTIAMPDVSETVLHGAAALLLEYRFANRWIAASSVRVQAENGGLTPWSLSVPFRLGVIW